MPRVLAAAAVLGACAGAQAESTWKDLFQPPFTGSPLQVMLGVSCTAVNSCFVAGGNTNGMGVFKVTDPTFKSGVTQLSTTGGSPLKMMLGVAMQDETHGVAGGLGIAVGGTYYTVDGQEFQTSSLQYGILTTQALYSLGSGKFAYVGMYNGQNGVAVSENGGVTFKGHWWPKDFSEAAPPRYGAFPTDEVMYVTGGSWPSDNSTPSGTHDLTARLRFNGNTNKYEQRAPVLGATTAGYTAVIAKSNDGGATWEKQFESLGGDFYFNGISCASATVCMAVAEGAAGAHVFKTENGKTWTKIFSYGNATGGSAMDVKMLSETEAWVGFTYATSTFNSGAVMAHTTDGGKTWDLSAPMNGVGAVTQMSFVDDNTAFAAAVTVYQISTVLAFGQ